MNLAVQSHGFPVLVDMIINKREGGWVHDIAISLLGSLLIAITAQIAIPLPFTPVPITGQTFGALMVGITLGAKRGALSALFYIIEGALGMPVFAGLKGGLPYLFGPTGGYIIGFVPAAFITGYLAQRGWDRGFIKTVLSMAAGNAAIYLFGISGLCVCTGFKDTLVLGLYPFMIGDGIKILLAAFSAPLVWRKLIKN